MVGVSTLFYCQTSSTVVCLFLEKLNVKVVTPSYNEGVMSTEEAMHISKAQEENKTLLSIPRRLVWNKYDYINN